MATDARPLKRTRIDSDSIPDATSSKSTMQGDIKRSEEFWLEDGNLVLVARDVAFRVYRGLLAAQSTVFQDMFASASPTTDEAFDGCPVVRLSDSPEDLLHLLRVLLPMTNRTWVLCFLAFPVR